ncbi:MAG: signal peptidase II [Ilumatobacter sp.]|nr:MAG: signal peptidase II [Ilumatobacter sp.]
MNGPSRALRGSVVIAVAIVVIDQLTKQWALSALAEGPIDVIWTLRFNLVFNRGMAFSQAEGLGPIIGVVALVIVVVLLVSLRKGSGTLGTVGVGLIVGGALGNVIDRLFRDEGWLRGAVVDFIDFQWFPVFNVADMAINVGAACLILGAFSSSRREATDGPEVAEVHDEAADTGDGTTP